MCALSHPSVLDDLACTFRDTPESGVGVSARVGHTEGRSTPEEMFSLYPSYAAVLAKKIVCEKGSAVHFPCPLDCLFLYTLEKIAFLPSGCEKTTSSPGMELTTNHTFQEVKISGYTGSMCHNKRESRITTRRRVPQDFLQCDTCAL